MGTKTEATFSLMILLMQLQLCYTNPACPNHNCADISNINVFAMQTEVGDNEIQLSWDFNSSDSIYGFNAVILDEDNATMYVSPILLASERMITIGYEVTNVESLVCLRALINATELLQAKCERIKVSDFRIIIGILAGTIFIIPCIIVMVCIIYKDYQVRKEENYAELLHQDSESIEVPGKFQTDKLDDTSVSSNDSTDSHVASEKVYVSEKISVKDETICKDEKSVRNRKLETENEEKMKEAQGEDNLSFVQEDSVVKTTRSDSKDNKDELNVINACCDREQEDSDSGRDSDDHINESNEITESRETANDTLSSNKSKNVITLKVDINLARRMAEADNESKIFDYRF